MRTIDVARPLENGVWSYPDPYPKVQIEEIAMPDWVPYDTYSWVFTIGTQSGAYLETAAHMFRDAITIDQVSLERLILDAAVVSLPEKEPNEAITAAELQAAAVEVRP